MTQHPRQHQATTRHCAFFQVVAFTEIRVRHDRLACDFIERDILRRQFWCSRDDDGMFDQVRVIDGPLQHLHTTQAATDNGAPVFDIKRQHKAVLTQGPVLHGNDRKVRPPVFTALRIDGIGPGRTFAATQVIDTDNKKFISINGLTRTYSVIPPAGFFIIHAVITGSMLVTGQRMTDQYGITGISI